MKRLKLLLLLPMLLLTGCNHDISLGKYAFYFAHVQMYGNQAPVHLKVKSWKSDDGGIELVTQNYGSILLGDGTYMLYGQDKDKTPECPICGKVNYK